MIDRNIVDKDKNSYTSWSQIKSGTKSCDVIKIQKTNVNMNTFLSSLSILGKNKHKYNRFEVVHSS